MRIAVIDIGTNSTRLYVAEVSDGRVEAELERTSRVTRLGAGVDRTGVLAPESIKRECAVLADYQQRLRELHPQRQVAVMTSAVRDAQNGRQFSVDVAKRFGLDVHVLSGEEEARLTYRGATDSLELNGDGGQTLVFDIGGGSTELITGAERVPAFHVSTQAGVVRQADRHIAHDPPQAGELHAIASEVGEILDQAIPTARRGGIGRALGVAGTPTALAAIAQQLEVYDRSRVHGYRLTSIERDAIFKRLAALPLAQRQQVVGLHPDRALAILPGVVILTVVMELFSLDAIEVSEHDILRGAAISYGSA